MSSPGQIIGTIAGAVIGAFVPGGYIMLGASIGGMIGGAIDPPKGPKIDGPRLNDLAVQLVGYGNPIPRVYGTTALFGTIFWVENGALKESSHTQTQSAKGGGDGAETTTYSYSATFALALCQGPISGIKRIWIAGKLVYDAGATTLGAIVANEEFNGSLVGGGSKFTLYKGEDDQLPDPRMQATLGIANTPAYRGLAYLVWEDLPLADFGNSLMGAQIKVEVVTGPMTYDWASTFRLDNALDVMFLTYTTSPDTGIGPPYISRIVSGVVYVSVPGLAQSHRFSQFDGTYLGADGDDIYINTVPNFYEYFNYWQEVGRVADGRALYVKHTTGSDIATPTGIIGYGPIEQVAGPKFKVSGVHIDAEIISHRVANGYSAVYWPQFVALNKDNDYIFVTVTDNDFWYLLDLDGHIVDQGVWVYTSGTTKGFGRWGTFSVCMDYEARRFVIASSTNLYIYEIQADSTIVQTKYISTTIGFNADPFTSFIYGDVITMITHRSFEVVTYHLVGTEDITLGEIVTAESLLSKVLDEADIVTSALTSVVRGYTVTQTAAIRAAIDPLRSAWPFDVIASGYQIKAVPRGGASVASIDVSELGAVSGNDKPAPRITNSREMDLQMPRRVELTYLDSEREYDTGEQFAERLNTDAVNTLRVEMPIVLNADEAAGKAEVLLYLYWLERNDVSFVLPPPYTTLEPSDVITVVAPDASYELRLTTTNLLPDGRLECTAKFNSAAVYTPTAQGESGAVTGQTLTTAGPCDLLLLDIPCVDSTYMNAPGVLAGLSPMFSTWKGGVIFRSDDGGQSWGGVQGFAPPGAISGNVETAIGAGSTHVIDTKNVIGARVNGGALSSVSDAALFNGANHFAYGVHGRWEIIAAKTAVEQADGSYTLSNLMRGRFGTEWAMTTHAAFDRIVLLDAAALRFITMNPASINMSRAWRGVSDGYSLDSVPPVDFAYTGVNLKCLSPTALRGSRTLSTLDWTLEWTRRSRLPVEPFSGVATPLGESAESYEVEIWNSDYSTLKRTLTGLASTFSTYSQANQISDFGSEQSTVYFKVRQVSSVVGAGFPAQSSVYHDLPIDPFIDLVILAIHFDGAHGSTTFTTVAGGAATAVGNAMISTTQYKFGGASGYFDGAGDSLTISSAGSIAGTGDFTIDFWVRPSALGGYQQLIANDTAGGFACALGPTGLIDFGRSLVATDGTGSVSISSGAWSHIAFVRTSSTLKLYINGTLDSSFSCATSFVSGVVRIAADGGGGTRYLNGYIDDLRITNAARWSADFALPVTPFPDP